jgi:hypothetical protein
MFSGWGILFATSAEQLGVTELIANKLDSQKKERLLIS